VKRVIYNRLAHRSHRTTQHIGLRDGQTTSALYRYTIYLKLRSKSPTPSEFRKCRFWQIWLNSAAVVRASAKSSIIANRKSTMRFLLSHRWTLCVTPKSPKGWHKTRIFTFGVALHFFVTGNRRHFKINMWVEHSKSHSQPTDDKTSLKWAWPRHATHFKLLFPLIYLWNGLSYRLLCACWP